MLVGINKDSLLGTINSANHNFVLRSSGYIEVGKIKIDDNGGSGSGYHTWDWYKSNYPSWCSGFGTWNEPYVINNIEINAGGSDSCIIIRDSNIFFIINSSKVYNSGKTSWDAGIRLINTNNGKINNIDCNNNKRYGFWLDNCHNNSIINCNITYNSDRGIRLDYSNYNKITGSNVSNNDISGIALYYSEYNEVWDNIANENIHGGIYFRNSNHSYFYDNSVWNNAYGIQLDWYSRNNSVCNNDAFNNSYGIWLYESLNNTISENTVYNNTDYGISLILSENNTISDNLIEYNPYGIYMERNLNITIIENDVLRNQKGIFLYRSNYSFIYKNNFINPSGTNGIDNGTNNLWDNGAIGNYWHDYPGTDINDDGIGDTPYNIQGPALSQDIKPIFWDPPIFSVILPLNTDLYGKNPPSYQISIDEGIAHTTWYTISQDMITIVSEISNLEGTIKQSDWDIFGNGTMSITFFVNDSKGLIDSEVFYIKKDVLIPDIKIIYPQENQIFTEDPPNYEISIVEPHLNKIWYTLDGGLTNITINSLTGTIDENIWDSFGEEKVTIIFYASDVLGHIGSAKVIVEKIQLKTDRNGFNTGLLITIIGVTMGVIGIAAIVGLTLYLKKKRRIVDDVIDEEL
ncbi:MAG: nitrous oxide reductase family maturation protein NosD [Promethearchaeota archaeon]